MPTLLEKQKLLEEIKGIRRIVVNKCHGGFGISQKAVLRYLELQGIKVWYEVDPKWASLGMGTYWLVPPEADRVVSNPENWHDMSMAERIAHNQKYSDQVFQPRDIARDDPYLVKVVMELGDEANDRHAELSIVEVPEEVDWVIEEYDGKEWIAERHRTWS